MNISGRVHNGVIIPDEKLPLPEGAVVVISYLAATPKAVAKQLVQFPLVVTGKPGSVNLTNQRIAEILDEEDAASRH